jgi:hypothetical protein
MKKKIIQNHYLENNNEIGIKYEINQEYLHYKKKLWSLKVQKYLQG